MTLPPFRTTEAPWWTHYVQLIVELGIGTFTNKAAVGRWGRAHWDKPLTGTWSGLEPTWTPIDQCSLLAVTVTRGRSRALDRFGASSATVTADDATGVLSWDSDDHADQLSVRPGTAMRIRALDLATGIEYPIWRGFVETVEDAFAPHDRPAATLTAQDALAQLAHIDPPEQPPVGAGERTDQRVNRLLDVAAWPADWRDIQTGLITVQATNLARNIVDDLGITADSESGALFASRDGKVTFRNRDWLRTDPHATAVQARIGGDD